MSQNNVKYLFYAYELDEGSREVLLQLSKGDLNVEIVNSIEEISVEISENKNHIGGVVLFGYQYVLDNLLDIGLMSVQISQIPYCLISFDEIDEEKIEVFKKYKINYFYIKKDEELNSYSKVMNFLQSRSDDIEESQMLRSSFLEESREIIADLEPLLLEIENDPNNKENYDKIFRLVHTVKGASGVLDRADVTHFFHCFEDVINKIKVESNRVDTITVDLLLKSFDVMITIINSFENEQENDLNLNQSTATLEIYELPAFSSDNQIKSVEKESEKELAIDTSDQNTIEGKEKITVPSEVLDMLLSQSSEITVIRNTLKDLVGAMQKKYPEELDVVIVSNYLEELSRLNSIMQHQLTDQRNTPVTESVKRLPRMVRDLSKQLGKKAQVDVHGKNLRVDPKIAQVLSMSMTHLIRNSMDHGIETPEERLLKQKKESGVIEITFSKDHENIFVNIKDDGNGIDPDRIKSKVIENGMYTERELEKFSKEKILGQIFEPGFSTASELTDVSGRGVGMDMVKSGINDLGGEIKVRSELGKGSNFIITFPIPTSESVISALVVETSHSFFAIPQDVISRLLSIKDEDEVSRRIERINSVDLLLIEEKYVPILILDDLLFPDQKHSLFDYRDFVILDMDGVLVALAIENIFDMQDLVVKSVPNTILKTDLYKGATLMSDRSVALILDCKKIASNFVAGSRDGVSNNVEIEKKHEVTKEVNLESYMIVRLSGEEAACAVLLDDIYRLEEIKLDQCQRYGENYITTYRDSISNVIDLSKTINRCELSKNSLVCLVVKDKDRFYLLAVDEVVNIVSIEHVSQSKVVEKGYIDSRFMYDNEIIRIINVGCVIQTNYSKENMTKDRRVHKIS